MPGRKHVAKWCVGVDRSFSDEELDRFLAVVDDPRLRLAYELMARLGLRRSEIVLIRRSDIFLDKSKPYIRIHNVKNKRFDTLRLHHTAVPLLEDYLERWKEEIDNHDGHLLWSDNRASVSFLKLTCEILTWTLLSGPNCRR